MTPRSSAEYYLRQQQLTLKAIKAILAAWRQMEPTGNWEDQYRSDVGLKITALILAAQLAATRDADSYVAQVIKELALGAASPGVVPARAFLGLAGDGRPVPSLLYGVVVQAGMSYNLQRSVATEATDLTRSAARALGDAEEWLTKVSATILADTARATESAAIATHGQVTGYVRMLNLPSCSRCIVLAGRFYRWSDGFERHPECDCRHIVATRATYGDLTTNPNKAFESIPTAAELDSRHPDLTVKMRRAAGLHSQEDVFTQAGAEAIRSGADISQVVNARSGMRTAQLYGHDVLVTTTGTTKRAGFGRSQTEFVGTDVGRRGAVKNYVERRTVRARLMPESIFRVAKDRTDAVRLLKLYGYIN